MKIASLFLLAVCLAAETALAQSSPPASATLAAGTTVEGELAGGQTRVHQIHLERGQIGVLQLEQRGIDVAIELLGSEGEVVAHFDSESRREGVEELALVAEASGTHLRVKATLKHASPGRYALRFLEARTATEDERTLHEGRKLRAQAARLHAAGNNEEALPLIEEARSRAEKVLGPEHALAAQWLREAGDFHFAQADYEEAKARYAKALAPSKKLWDRTISRPQKRGRVWAAHWSRWARSPRQTHFCARRWQRKRKRWDLSILGWRAA